MILLNIKRNLKYWVVVAFLFGSDSLAGLFAFNKTISLILDEKSFSYSENIFFFIVIQLLLAGLFYANGRYRVDPTLSRFREIQSILRITLSSTIVAIVLNEIFPFVLNMESVLMLAFWFYMVAGLVLGRMSIRLIQKLLMVRGYGKKNTIIIGTDKRAKEIAGHLLLESTGHNLIGFIKSGNIEDSKVENDFPSPILGELNNIRKIIDFHHINEVVIALERPEHNRLLEILTRANGAPVSLRIIPDMYEVISGLAKTEELYGLPLVEINPEILTMQQRFAKRYLDIIVSTFVILAAFPLWLIIAIAIKLESKGPILYRQ